MARDYRIEMGFIELRFWAENEGGIPGVPQGYRAKILHKPLSMLKVPPVPRKSHYLRRVECVMLYKCKTRVIRWNGRFLAVPAVLRCQ
jgi:hypothetical protein